MFIHITIDYYTLCLYIRFYSDSNGSRIPTPLDYADRHASDYSEPCGIRVMFCYSVYKSVYQHTRARGGDERSGCKQNIG